MTSPAVQGLFEKRFERIRIVGLLAAAAVMAITGATALAQRAPSPVPTGLSPEVLSLACAPSLAYEVPQESLRVTGSQEIV